MTQSAPPPDDPAPDDPVPGGFRTLPLRVRLVDGEALDSWLLRLASRNSVPLRVLTNLFGLGQRQRIRRNYALTKDLPAVTLRRIETQAGLSTGALDAAVLDQFDPLGWTPIPGSRYCPKCLSENGGWWPLRWQLPHTFACLTHQCLLAAVCPTCERIPHNRISLRSVPRGTTRCTLAATRHERPCEADLLTTDGPAPLDADDPRLAAQAWINQRLDDTDSAAITDLRDLDAITSWLPWRVTPADLEHLGNATVAAVAAHRENNSALRRHNPAASLVAAAMACHAIDIISPDTLREHASTPGNLNASGQKRWQARLAPFTRDVDSFYRDHEPTTRAGVLMILSAKRLNSLSPSLRRAVLGGIDEDLSATERLRYRTRTRAPRPPGQSPEAASTVADRARWIPQRLWPDWLVRFHPVTSTCPADIAVTIAAALLIPGNPARNIGATDELTRWRPDMGTTLRGLAHSHPDVLTAICNLTDHLDHHSPPIDYRRRRATFATTSLTADQWRAICAAAPHPGHDARLLHARRHLFTLLTGANLYDPGHPLALTTPDERGRYEAFEMQMPTTLRNALHDHAAALLTTAGIHEPVTWSPPAHVVAGLDLPGREPDDIDTTALRQLIGNDRARPRALARLLGVSTPHLYYATSRMHRPVSQPASRSKPRTRARAERILTAAFFDQEYTQAGKDLSVLAAETGFTRATIRKYAKRAGIPPVVRGGAGGARSHGLG